MNSPAAPETLHVCVLTPVGRGAIATIALRGITGAEVVAQFFRPNAGTTRLPVDRIRYGIWLRTNPVPQSSTPSTEQPSDAEYGESIVVCATSETEVEIHCHGGRAAVAAIVEDLVTAGAMLQDASDWLRDSGQDFLTNECQLVLANTQTAKTAGIVLDQIRGAIADSTRAAIQDIISGNLSDAAARITAMSDRYCIGRGVSAAFRVVIAGPPNVGKSSLMNQLLGYDRAIAYDQPGTTRDVLSALTTLDGWTVEFRDTAGIHETEEAIEREGVRSARREVQSADAVVIVVDAAVGPTAEHKQIAALVEQPIYVWNKVDLIDQTSLASNNDALLTSARLRLGIDELIAALVQQLIGTPHVPGSAVPITPRQFACLKEAGESLADNNQAASIAPLQRLLHGAPDDAQSTRKP